MRVGEGGTYHMLFSLSGVVGTKIVESDHFSIAIESRLCGFAGALDQIRVKWACVVVL